MNTVQLSQRFSAIERQVAEIKEALIKAQIMEAPAPPPTPAEIPFATDIRVTHRFRASMQRTFSVLCNFTCPACDKHEENREFFVAENGAVVTTACASCEQNLRIKLQWEPSMK
jgi:hypothetical protein